jgi:transcriptional repressor NrdR
VIILTNVVKRKGSVETFNPDKIRGSLQKAAIDAGYSVEEKEDIIQEVLDNVDKAISKDKDVETKTIRACLLTELERCEPYMAKSWRRFDNRYKNP